MRCSSTAWTLALVLLASSAWAQEVEVVVHSVAPAVDLELVHHRHPEGPWSPGWDYPPRRGIEPGLALRRFSSGEIAGYVSSLGGGLTRPRSCEGWEGRDLVRAELDPAGRYAIVTRAAVPLRESMVPEPGAQESLLNGDLLCYSIPVEEGLHYRTSVTALPGSQLVFHDLTSGRWAPWAISPDGDTLVLADGPGQLRLFDTRAYEEHRHLLHGVSARDAFHEVLIEGAEARDWLGWDDRPVWSVPELVAPESGDFSLAFSADGRFLATLEVRPDADGVSPVRQVVRSFPAGDVVETRLLLEFPEEFRGRPLRRHGPRVLAAKRAALRTRS